MKCVCEHLSYSSHLSNTDFLQAFLCFFPTMGFPHSEIYEATHADTATSERFIEFLYA